MEQVSVSPGVRFYPTEEELITFYLHNKLHGQGPDLEPVIPSIDIYNFEPSQLPGLAGRLCQGEEQWFFFMAQRENEARGGRAKRTTDCGYWKATGSPSYVYSHTNNKVIGVKKIMVFYKGKVPNGRKTKWKMNEYKALNQQSIINNTSTSTSTTGSSSSTTILKMRDEFSLCRVYVTSGCARAFDRRPPPGTMSTTMAQLVAANNNNNQGQEIIGRASQNLNATTFLIERRSSTYSSNSEGNDQVTLQYKEAAAGSSNSTYHEIEMQAAQDLESLWDLEQLNNWL